MTEPKAHEVVSRTKQPSHKANEFSFTWLARVNMFILSKKIRELNKAAPRMRDSKVLLFPN